MSEALLDTFKRYALPVLVLMAVAIAWLQPLDTAATEQAQAGLKRAVTSFATARALNAVISMAQGTEFSLQPFGVGVNLAPGQLLDPLNDLVEQFADLMLMASVAFGAQVLLLKMGIHWGMSLALTLVAGLWAWLCWRNAASPRLISRLLIALLLVRFIVPIAGMAGDLTYRVFMEQEYAASQSGIEKSARTFRSLTPTHGASDMKWWEFSQRIEQVKDTVDQTVEYTIRLIVVFLLQTLVLPLAAFWILLRTGRMLTTTQPA